MTKPNETSQLFVIRYLGLIRHSSFAIRYFSPLGHSSSSLYHSFMISALTGTLRQVEEDRIQLESGPIVYELLISAADAQSLADSVGQEITFQTLMYLEGDPNRGNLEPRLIGFVSARDKKFFELFTTVNGIGPKKALKALSAPIADIARAIETSNTRF